MITQDKLDWLERLYVTGDPLAYSADVAELIYHIKGLAHERDQAIAKAAAANDMKKDIYLEAKDKLRFRAMDAEAARDNYRKQVTSATKALQVKQDRIEEMTGLLEEARDCIQQQMAKIEADKGYISACEQGGKALADRNEELQRQLDDLEAIPQLTDHDLIAQVKSMSGTIDGLQAKNSQLQNANDRLDRENQDLLETLTELKPKRIFKRKGKKW